MRWRGRYTIPFEDATVVVLPDALEMLLNCARESASLLVVVGRYLGRATIDHLPAPSAWLDTSVASEGCMCEEAESSELEPSRASSEYQHMTDTLQGSEEILISRSRPDVYGVRLRWYQRDHMP